MANSKPRSQSCTVYQNNVFAQLYHKNEIVWAYMNNEYQKCRIIKVLHPKNSCEDDTDDDIDENEATPPLLNSDTLSNCSTPPVSTQLADEQSTPEPPESGSINDGLCSSLMPIYCVICRTPRFEPDKCCKYFLQNKRCRFYEENKCIYSHG